MLADGLGQIAVAEHHDFGRAGIDRELLEQAIAEQRHRLDVALEPAEVGRGDAGDAMLDLLARAA